MEQMKIDKKEKLYKIRKIIKENMHPLDSFSNTFLHESLWPTFKTVYAHCKLKWS